jgi:ClpP class serine protease
MGLDVLINATTGVNSTGAASFIPIKIMSEAQPYQFWISILVSGFMLLIVGYSFFKGHFSGMAIKSSLKKFNKITGKQTILLNHSSEGLFNSEMITRQMIPKLNGFLSKLKGKPFNLILQTPGGDVFATILLSKILKSYGNKIDVYVPNYSMSGGSLLTLTGSTMHFNDYSCIGPIDPQIGNMFNYGSAAGWSEVMKMKGKKAADSTIIFHRVGKQVEKSINEYIFSLVKDKCKKPKQFVDFITKGGIEHIYQIDSAKLRSYGFDTINITAEEKTLLDKILKTKTENMPEIMMV